MISQFCKWMALSQMLGALQLFPCIHQNNLSLIFLFQNVLALKMLLSFGSEVSRDPLQVPLMNAQRKPKST